MAEFRGVFGIFRFPAELFLLPEACHRLHFLSNGKFHCATLLGISRDRRGCVPIFLQFPHQAARLAPFSPRKTLSTVRGLAYKTENSGPAGMTGGKTDRGQK